MGVADAAVWTKPCVGHGSAGRGTVTAAVAAAQPMILTIVSAIGALGALLLPAAPQIGLARLLTDMPEVARPVSEYKRLRPDR